VLYDSRVANESLEVLTRVGRALADPSRAQIMLTLLDGPTYPGVLAARWGQSRANVSNHLACLRGCGLVTATRQGRRVSYELADPALAHALRDLVDLVLEVDRSVACQPAADASGASLREVS
jgi:ArsR family transcriptional regulator, cadmium/lead-responsive transcriptional repressor